MLMHADYMLTACSDKRDSDPPFCLEGRSSERIFYGVEIARCEEIPAALLQEARGFKCGPPHPDRGALWPRGQCVPR